MNNTNTNVRALSLIVAATARTLSVLETPPALDTPDTPATVAAPEPVTPVTPDTPDAPATVETPATPDAPELVTPATVETPATIEARKKEKEKQAAEKQAAFKSDMEKAKTKAAIHREHLMIHRELFRSIYPARYIPETVFPIKPYKKTPDGKNPRHIAPVLCGMKIDLYSCINPYYGKKDYGYINIDDYMKYHCKYVKYPRPEYIPVMESLVFDCTIDLFPEIDYTELFIETECFSLPKNDWIDMYNAIFPVYPIGPDGTKTLKWKQDTNSVYIDSIIEQDTPDIPDDIKVIWKETPADIIPDTPDMTGKKSAIVTLLNITPARGLCHTPKAFDIKDVKTIYGQRPKKSPFIYINDIEIMKETERAEYITETVSGLIEKSADLPTLRTDWIDTVSAPDRETGKKTPDILKYYDNSGRLTLSNIPMNTGYISRVTRDDHDIVNIRIKTDKFSSKTEFKKYLKTKTLRYTERVEKVDFTERNGHEIVSTAQYMTGKSHIEKVIHTWNFLTDSKLKMVKTSAGVICAVITITLKGNAIKAKTGQKFEKELIQAKQETPATVETPEKKLNKIELDLMRAEKVMEKAMDNPEKNPYGLNPHTESYQDAQKQAKKERSIDNAIRAHNRLEYKPKQEKGPETGIDYKPVQFDGIRYINRLIDLKNRNLNRRTFTCPVILPREKGAEKATIKQVKSSIVYFEKRIFPVFNNQAFRCPVILPRGKRAKKVNMKMVKSNIVLPVSGKKRIERIKAARFNQESFTSTVYAPIDDRSKYLVVLRKSVSVVRSSLNDKFSHLSQKSDSSSQVNALRDIQNDLNRFSMDLNSLMKIHDREFDCNLTVYDHDGVPIDYTPAIDWKSFQSRFQSSTAYDIIMSVFAKIMEFITIHPDYTGRNMFIDRVRYIQNARYHDLKSMEKISRLAANRYSGDVIKSGMFLSLLYKQASDGITGQGINASRDTSGVMIISDIKTDFTCKIPEKVQPVKKGRGRPKKGAETPCNLVYTPSMDNLPYDFRYITGVLNLQWSKTELQVVNALQDLRARGVAPSHRLISDLLAIDHKMIGYVLNKMKDQILEVISKFDIFDLSPKKYNELKQGIINTERFLTVFESGKTPININPVTTNPETSGHISKEIETGNENGKNSGMDVKNISYN